MVLCTSPYFTIIALSCITKIRCNNVTEIVDLKSLMTSVSSSHTFVTCLRRKNVGSSRNQDVYHSRTPHKEQRQQRMLDNEKDKGVCPDLISSSFFDVW